MLTVLNAFDYNLEADKLNKINCSCSDIMYIAIASIMLGCLYFLYIFVLNCNINKVKFILLILDQTVKVKLLHDVIFP